MEGLRTLRNLSETTAPWRERENDGRTERVRKKREKKKTLAPVTFWL